MLRKVASYIEKYRLLQSKKAVLVGLSGGTDSVTLLSVLKALDYPCIAAHCNFHLRGEESNRDEAFVVELCKKKEIRLLKTDFDTFGYAQLKGISIEMAARELRYNWFYEIAGENNVQAIAIAHHADDNIETLLLNLCRGTGLKGLTGIPVKNDKIVRPLLCCTRREIENYVTVNSLSSVEDSTNALVDYKRNRLRNEIIPLLEAINPSVRKTLYESIERFDGIFRVYNNAINSIRENLLSEGENCIKIDIKKLEKQADIPTVLFELLNEYAFNASQVKQIANSIYEESGKQFFAENYILTKDRDFLIIVKKQENSDEVYVIDENCEMINHPINLTIKKYKITHDFDISKSADCVQVDANKLAFPLTIRRWRNGDAFYPFGMKNKKKISDFFIDIKLSRSEKEQVWLLLSRKEIVWVIGKRLDNRFRVTGSTKSIVEFNLSNACQ